MPTYHPFIIAFNQKRNKKVLFGEEHKRNHMSLMYVCASDHETECKNKFMYLFGFNQLRNQTCCAEMSKEREKKTKATQKMRKKQE